MHTLLGLQYRPTFFINIYNRLRSLDFSDETRSTSSRLNQRIKGKATGVGVESSLLTGGFIQNECAARDQNATAISVEKSDNDDDSTFSFTDLNELNNEINHFF